MLDTCTITRGASIPVFDEATGEYVTPAGVVVYEGRCKVQTPRTLAPENPDAGGREWAVQTMEVHVPASVVGVDLGDSVMVTASAMDAALVGRAYRVVDDPARSFGTARRLRCEEVVG